MGRSINSNNLNKKTILDKVSQISIFSEYFNIPVEVIQHCIDTGELILSPIRDDRHPTVGFRYDNKGKLKMRDFAGYFWGDCFDAVAYILSLTDNTFKSVNDKDNFIKVLRHITFTFKNIFYGEEKDPNLKSQILQAIELSKNTKPIIELVVRNWNEYDKVYWNTYGVTLQHLNLNFVYPVEQYYINRKTNPEPKYYYKTSDPCYAYFLGRDKYGISNIKLYFPERHKPLIKFITNCNHLEGIYNLSRNDYNYIVITKSSKDRLSIGCALLSLFPYGVMPNIKIGVINIPHETYKLRTLEIDWLKGKLNENGKLVSLMDNDRVGIVEANYLRKAFNIIPIFIPKESGCKDFAEYYSKTNIDEIIQTILQSITIIDNYEKDKHSWYLRQSNIAPF